MTVSNPQAFTLKLDISKSCHSFCVQCDWIAECKIVSKKQAS